MRVVFDGLIMNSKNKKKVRVVRRSIVYDRNISNIEVCVYVVIVLGFYAYTTPSVIRYFSVP